MGMTLDSHLLQFHLIDVVIARGPTLHHKDDGMNECSMKYQADLSLSGHNELGEACVTTWIDDSIVRCCN